jgi:hypothetical protein
MQEWIAPVVGLVGVLFGTGIAEFRNWRERKDRYRAMTFEKRLQTHQEALSLCYTLNHTLNTGRDFEKRHWVGHAESWWQSHCLFLDEASRRKMHTLIVEAQDYVYGQAESRTKVFALITETRNAITQGIGIEHLPEKPERR